VYTLSGHRLQESTELFFRRHGVRTRASIPISDKFMTYTCPVFTLMRSKEFESRKKTAGTHGIGLPIIVKMPNNAQ